jgi:hypothetical protein
VGSSLKTWNVVGVSHAHSSDVGRKLAGKDSLTRLIKPHLDLVFSRHWIENGCPQTNELPPSTSDNATDSNLPNLPVENPAPPKPPVESWVYGSTFNAGILPHGHSFRT